MTDGLSASDIALLQGNGRNNGDGFGDGNGWWIILFFLCMFGWGGRGFGGFGGFGGGSGSAVDGYVLTSDFANIERKIDGVNTGLCDGFYTQAHLVNGVNMNIMQGNNAIQSQLAQCCCDIREGISGINYNLATQACGIGRQIESGFAQTNYNMAAQNSQTLQAIDKVGDRVIDYLANEKMQTLRDENQALRLAASQQAQNNYLIDQLGQKCPIPAYITCNPFAPVQNNCCCGCN